MKSPLTRGMAYEDVEIQSADGIMVRGWFIKHYPGRKAPTVVFFHENAGNIGMRLQYLLHYQKNVNCNILIVAYRGY